MCTSTLRLFAARVARLVGAMSLLPALLVAQAGRITGTVNNAARAPLADALVTLAGTNLQVSTSADGRFVIANLRPGTHTILVRRIGSLPRSVSVEVPAGQDAQVTVVLDDAPQELAPVVVSASRRVEKITDAPATISRLDANVIQRAAGYGITNALKEVKGIDFVQTGVTTAAINARGFNSSFNTRMLQMEDGRIAVLGESSLPLGIFTTIPKVDVAGVEVLVGPGAALYGPDASNGVITLETKDPKLYPGFTADLTLGNRSFYDQQLRYAGSRGDWGYKIAGEYLTANEFRNSLNYGPVAGGPARTPEADIDWTAQSQRLTGALAYYRGANRLQFGGGYSSNDGVGQTNVGRNQLVNYSYNYQQAKLTMPSWYFNVYRAGSNTGDTYAINAFSQNRLLAASTVSDDSVKHLSDFPGHSSLYAAEIQNNLTLRPLLDTRLIWGGQVRHDIVSSERQWLDDRIAGEDIQVTQLGVYAQTETPFAERFRLVLAARYDKHEDYDEQFSPKAALLFSPIIDNTIRVSYSRAFKSPTILQTHFAAADFARVTPTVSVGVFGNREGFTVRNSAGDIQSTIDPLVPETNDTWELGYKGILGGRAYIDVTGYLGNYQDFLSPLITIANPLLGTFAHDADGNKIVGPTGNEQIVLTYVNIGQADIRGVDAGLRFLVTPKMSIAGTWSTIHLEPVDTVGKPAAIREATALNTSPQKWRLGMDFTDLPRNAFFGFGVRDVVGYFFRSGINVGTIPGHTAFDAHVGYNIPSVGLTLSVAVNNLFACSEGRYTLGATEAPPGTFDQERKCGFGEKHMEMINSPEVGTVVFFGVRYHR